MLDKQSKDMPNYQVALEHKQIVKQTLMFCCWEVINYRKVNLRECLSYAQIGRVSYELLCGICHGWALNWCGGLKQLLGYCL